MARIAVGGWQHETNTFATIKADYHSFEKADEWPPLSTGEALFRNTKGVHLPITGAIAFLQQQQHQLVPLLWCSATPCSYVTEDAFERICAQFIQAIEAALPLDGIYLDLHGAMVCEHLQDGEGEFLKRVRQLVGDQLPISVSLDLHANVTPLMVQQATIIDIFRTYPHIDMGETGERAARHLHQLLMTGDPLYVAFRQLDFMIALNFGCSLIEPCQSVYGALPSYNNDKVPAISFACGFHLSDIHDVGPSLLAYGVTPDDANNAADAFLELIDSHRRDFGQKIWPAAEAVAHAIEQLEQGARTIVLADTQDNPGGGGSGDTTGLLQEMIVQQANAAVFGVVCDPLTVAAAEHAGVGKVFAASLGGKSGLAGQSPFECECRVLKLCTGNFIATGPMYKGAKMTLGPCALVEIGGVDVALSSSPIQNADQAIFRHFGIEPASRSILALKSSVHFRNDYTDLASEILVVAAPGAVFADPAKLHYQHKRWSIELN